MRVQTKIFVYLIVLYHDTGSADCLLAYMIIKTANKINPITLG